MMIQRLFLTMLAAGALLSPLGAGKCWAQRREFFAPYIYSTPYQPYQFGGGVGATTQGMPWTWSSVPSGYSYYSQPQVYSYVMPSPYYGILPPPFLTAHDLGNSRDSWSGKTAEDYGYTRDYFDGTPRKRGTLYPAIPNEAVIKQEDRQADSRRVRFDIKVPNPDAVLVMDGAKTRQAGTQREYVTPPLQLDRLYTSTIEIYWFDDTGKKFERKKTFDFIAGETVRYAFPE